MSFKQYLAEARKELLGEESINSNKKLFAMVSKKNDGKFEKWEAKELQLDGDYNVVTRTVLGDDSAVVIEYPGEGFAVVTDFDLNESVLSSLDEGSMSDIHMIAKDSKDFKEFEKTIKKEYPKFSKDVIKNIYDEMMAIDEAVELESGWFNIPDTESKFGIDPTDVTEFLTDFEVDEGETGEGSFFIEFESAKERKAIVKALLNIGFKAKAIEKFIEAEED